MCFYLMKGINMEKVSVIVPVYQKEKTITRCLMSILKQSWKNLEIIAIDDGSTDGSLKVLKKIALLNNRVKVIHQENMGVSEARNRGVEEAKGKYLTFVDADDYISKNFIQTLVKIMKIKKSDWVGSLPQSHTNDTRKADIIWNGKVAKLGTIFSEEYKHYYFNHVCGKLFKTLLAKKIAFNKQICVGEDLLFNLNYIKLARFITLINFDGYKYVYNNHSITHTYRKNDFQNQKFLNQSVTSFYLNFLNGNKNGLFNIDEVFSIDILYRMCVLLISNIKNSKKRKIIEEIRNDVYYFLRIKHSKIADKKLKVVQKLYIYKCFNLLIVIGNIIKKVR